MENKRIIEYKKIPLILSLLFGVIFFLLLLKYFNKEAEISSLNLKDFYLKYSMYSPILFGLLSLIFLYLLIFLKFIFRIKSYIANMIIYFISFGFFLFLGLDLMFFESRIADFTKVIIETFSIPLIVSSSIMILIVILISLKKVKSEK